jgi:hypothetical protein
MTFMTFRIEERATAPGMSQTAPASSADPRSSKFTSSSSQSHPHIVKDINQALRELEAVDGLLFVELDLSDGKVLLRDEPAFEKLLSSPSRCPKLCTQGRRQPRMMPSIFAPPCCIASQSCTLSAYTMACFSTAPVSSLYSHHTKAAG